MHPQVPAEQRTQRLWCGKCFVSEIIGIDEVAEEQGWHEGRCPDCGSEDVGALDSIWLRKADVPLSDTSVHEAATP